VVWVERLTGMKGDSLKLFMYRFRPSYDFCRKTDRQGMTLYISEKLKEFRKPQKPVALLFIQFNDHGVVQLIYH
jgi:hypothetical protein